MSDETKVETTEETPFTGTVVESALLERLQGSNHSVLFFDWNTIPPEFIGRTFKVTLELLDVVENTETEKGEEE